MKTINGVKFYTHKEVFAKSMRSKTFRDAYETEKARSLLSRQVRELRTAKKLTQKQVADIAHMPQSVVARLESGSHSVSVSTLARIASVFGKGIQLA